MKSASNEVVGKYVRALKSIPSAMLTAKIVIIGAGAAGIAAAAKLLDNGFTNIQILEAEDRIGGRVHSLSFGASNVDLGAQWVHGEDDNIVYQMVRGKQLLETARCTYKDNTFYNSRGLRIDKTLTDELFSFAAAIMMSMEADNTSCGHYFIKNRVTQEYGCNESCTEIATQFMHWFHKLILCYDAAHSWFDISTNGLLQYKECDGDPLQHWKTEGYGHFFDTLMGKHATELHKQIILLNKCVKTIVWNTQTVIHCVDGSFYNADHVIMTASLGVLKERHQNMFIPALPAFKATAIAAHGFGLVNKIMLKFAEKWWTDETCFCFLWKDVDRFNLLNEMPFGPMTDGRSWLEDINGFYVIDSDPTVLMGWLLGDFARDAEALSDADVEKGCLFLLDKFLGDSYVIPKPESVLISRWYSNPNFRGSYSYRSIECEKQAATNAHLAEPLLAGGKKPVIQFAGEATHPYYYSTVHGAVESGYREAERIISYYNNRRLKTTDCGHNGLKLLSKI